MKVNKAEAWAEATFNKIDLYFILLKLYLVDSDDSAETPEVDDSHDEKNSSDDSVEISD